jgi:predicted PurR-regulated permease PerM
VATVQKLPSEEHETRAETTRSERLRQQRDLAFTVLAWVAVAGVGIWVLAHIIDTILLFLLGAIIAYAIAPVVHRLRRVMPKTAAIAVVYLSALSGLVGLFVAFVLIVLGQATSVAESILSLIQPGAGGRPSAAYQTLKDLGLPDDQVQQAIQSLTDTLHHTGGGFVNVGMGAVTAILGACIVGIISVYFVADGEQFSASLLANTPIRYRAHLRVLLASLDRVISGYIRGQVLLSLIIGALVGIGMWLLRVPNPLFLGVVAFVFEFVPMIGLWIIGAVCVVVAFSHGWITALLALGYFILASTFEADIASPRILGRAVNVHPVISLFALLAGAELFGLWGALFAAPAAGLAQALGRTYWAEWRAGHPQQFPEGDTVKDAQPTEPPSAHAPPEPEAVPIAMVTSVDQHATPTNGPSERQAKNGSHGRENGPQRWGATGDG